MFKLIGGCMKLKMYLLKNDMTLTAFCKKIDYDITYLSKISKGKRKPGRKLAKKIEDATNGEITIQEWEKGE
jgi:hypothetical protein